MDSGELEKLGLNKSESKVYLALLELGTSSAGTITDKSQVSPSKIYWILERLLQKGLVSYIVESKTKYYTAASPQKLAEYLEKEKQEIEQREKMLERMLPKLKRIQNLSGEEQGAEIFVGFSAMKNAYHTMYDSAKNGDEHLIFLRPSEEETKPEAVLFFNRLHKKSVSIGLRRKLLSRDSKAARLVFKSGPYAKRKQDSVRFTDISPEGINILNDYLLIMHLARKPICVLIHSKQMAQDYRELFNEMWKKAKA